VGISFIAKMIQSVRLAANWFIAGREIKKMRSYTN
jgi:hypothetical protein